MPVNLTITVVEKADGTKEIVVIGGNNGNLVVNRRERIKWKTESPSDIFKVYFEDAEEPGTSIWPFFGSKPDGADKDGEYLQVDSSEPVRTLLGTAPLAIKYDVVAVNPSGVPRLDPVLIIRPTLLSRLVFGVVCVLLGVAAGWVLAMIPFS